MVPTKTCILFDRPVELHSQPATQQDEWVIERLRGYRNGYFVEIGGHDGQRYSNTLALERHFGWRGLLVEADPDLCEWARVLRPNCIHDCVAVSVTNDSTVRFSRGGAWGGLVAFLHEAWRREAESRHTPEIWVPTATLRNILTRNHAPKLIDYLSLDIEGAEVPVLHEHFQSPTHHFRCLTVEFRDSDTLMQIRRIVEPQGYVLEQLRAWDAFFTFNPQVRP
jgi:FkbM family methyltransferase